MEPAIGRIVADNDRSIAAAERMLAVLAHPDPSTRDAVEFDEALAIAASNITEPAERDVMARLRASRGGALAGDPADVTAAITGLRALGDINRAAMRRADADARRLGLAGRWALTLLGLVGLLAGVVSTRRVRRAFLDPIGEVASVVDAWRGGERHRRCQPFPDTELSRVLVTFNELLDRSERVTWPSTGKAASEVRTALAVFMDRAGGRTALVDAEGELVAMSADAIALMAESGAEIQGALRERASSKWIEKDEPIARTSLRVVTLRADASAA
jgi:hypothetical protein